MVFGDNIDVDKVYGVDNTDDNETSYWIIMLILAMMMLLLIPGENLDDDNGNIDKKKVIILIMLISLPGEHECRRNWRRAMPARSSEHGTGRLALMIWLYGFMLSLGKPSLNEKKVWRKKCDPRPLNCNWGMSFVFPPHPEPCAQIDKILCRSQEHVIYEQ